MAVRIVWRLVRGVLFFSSERPQRSPSSFAGKQQRVEDAEYEVIETHIRDEN
jgi:hypothetical protein